MKTTLLICAGLLWALVASAPGAKKLSNDALGKVGFDQKLKQQVSLELAFRDEQGRSIQLGDYFGSQPVILVLGYYECPMLCSLVLNGLVESLQGLRLNVGEKFQVVNLSINPSEVPALAAAKKQNYVRRYGRLNTADGWHFLTGTEPAIERLAAEVGFGYAYDPTIRQYAHPSGFVVLTPEGKVSRYFFGIQFSNQELQSALAAASANQVGSVIEKLLLLCFHYNPISGKYAALVANLMRFAGLVTLLALGGWIVGMIRRERKASSQVPRAPAEASPPSISLPGS